jgi:hypothetical protein
MALGGDGFDGLEALRDRLEAAVLDVFDGSPATPLFASRVERQVRDQLRKEGLDATVDVLEQGRLVRIRLRERNRVRTLHLTVDVP